jgi:hypothetical protein
MAPSGDVDHSIGHREPVRDVRGLERERFIYSSRLARPG